MNSFHCDICHASVYPRVNGASEPICTQTWCNMCEADTPFHSVHEWPMADIAREEAIGRGVLPQGQDRPDCPVNGTCLDSCREVKPGVIVHSTPSLFNLVNKPKYPRISAIRKEASIQTDPELPPVPPPVRQRSNAIIFSEDEEWDEPSAKPPTILETQCSDLLEDATADEVPERVSLYMDPYGYLDGEDSNLLPPACIDLTWQEDDKNIAETDFQSHYDEVGAKRKNPHPNNSQPQRSWAGTWFLWKDDDSFNTMWERDPLTRLPKACEFDPQFKRFWSNPSISYAIIGKERCKTTNRLHLQITIYCKNKLRFSTLQRLAPGCRWSPCYKPLQANINYCRKDKDWIEKGARPLTKQEGALARLQLLNDYLSHPLQSLEEYDVIFEACKSLCAESMDLICDVMTYNNNKY